MHRIAILLHPKIAPPISSEHVFWSAFVAFVDNSSRGSPTRLAVQKEFTECNIYIDSSFYQLIDFHPWKKKQA